MAIEGTPENLVPVQLDSRRLAATRLAVIGTVLKTTPELVQQTSSYMAQLALEHTVGAGLKRIALGKRSKY